MGFGKVFKKSDTQGLKRFLQGYGLEVEALPFPDGPTIRVSHLVNSCTRSLALHVRLNRKMKVVESPSRRLAYAHGSGLHFALQNIVLPELNVLWGRWECESCIQGVGAPLPGQRPIDVAQRRPKKCEFCGNFQFKFIEYDLIDPELKLTGHCDGFISIPEKTGLGVVEIKSTNLAWKAKTGPFPTHLKQIQAYMFLTGAQWGSILYWDKQKDNPEDFLEFLVDRDEQIIGELRESLQLLWAAIAGGDLPPRICNSPNCSRAEECQVSRECFEGWQPEADCGAGLF